MNGRKFEFTGYVESINIKGVDTNSHQFLFSVVSPKGDKHWPFLLDTASVPLRYTAMVSLLTTAFGSGKIINLNTAPHREGQQGPPFAAEIEVVRDSA